MKIVFITGATSGIGKAFAKSGYKLALCGRREDRMSDIQEELSKLVPC